MPRRKGPGKLPDAQVIGLRRKYRELRETTREPYIATDERLAREYSISAATVRSIVIGRTRAAVGGPLDTERAEAAQVHYHPTAGEQAVEVVITAAGRGTIRLVYPPR